MKQLSNVSVLQHNIGMVENARFSLFVVEEEYGIQILLNVFVEMDGNGILKIVRDVRMDKFGMNLLFNACVLEEQSGMEHNAESFNNVETGKFGIQICGDVNALKTQEIMEFIA